MYFQIMSLVIARSSCSQRRWKKLHPWTTLVGNCLLKPTGECLACVLRWEHRCEHGCPHRRMCVCMWESAVNMNPGLWRYDHELNNGPLTRKKCVSRHFPDVCCASARPFQPQFSCKRDVAFREARPCLRTFSFPAFQLVHFLPVFFCLLFYMLMGHY